jgi:hypothetical protein
VKLVFEIEVAVVDIVLPVLVGPFEYPSRFISLVILSIKFVAFCLFLALALKQVLDEMSLVGETR